MSKSIGKGKFGKGQTRFGKKGHEASDDDLSDGFGDDNQSGSRTASTKPARGQSRRDLGEDNDNDDEKKTNTGALAKSGKRKPTKKPKQVGDGDDEDPEAGDQSEGDNDDENEDNKLRDDPDEAADDIKQSFTDAGIRLPPKLRRLGKVRPEDAEAIENEADAAGEADPAFIESVQEALDEVQLSIRNIALKTRGVSDQRRLAICIDNTKTAEKFTEALKIVVSDGEVKASLARAGLKIGTVGIRVLAALSGLAIIGVGSFLAIVSQTKPPAEIAASIASQVVSAGERVDNKVNQKFERDALKKANAQELIKLIGTNEAAVETDRTITPDALRKYREFKLMVATLNAQKQAAMDGSK